MKGLNGNVIIDIGSKQTTVQEKPLEGGKVIHLVSHRTGDVDVQRASGVVTGVPESVTGDYDVDMSVREGDNVYFEPNVMQLAETRGWKVGETSYAIPYHFLVAKVNDGIEMLNGKVLVEEKEYEEKTGHIYIPEGARHRKYNILKVLAIGNDNFRGKRRGKRFYEFGEDDIRVGDWILGNQFADFSLLGILQDDNNKKINRESIVAILRENETIAHGLFVMVEPLLKEEKRGKIIIPDNRKMRPIYGRILSMGSGAKGLKEGDIIRFKDKAQPEHDGKYFVHLDSILGTCKGDFKKWQDYSELSI